MAEDWRITADFDDAGRRYPARRMALSPAIRVGRARPPGRPGGGEPRRSVRLLSPTPSNSPGMLAESFALLSSERCRPRSPSSSGIPWSRNGRTPGFHCLTDEIQAEHARQQAREAAESLASGHAEWEVRVFSQPRGDRRLADRLEGEGIPVTRRSTFLLVGAVNEDEATRGGTPPPRGSGGRASRSSRAAPWSGRSAHATRSPSSEGSAATTFLRRLPCLRPGTATRGGRQWKLPVRPSRAVPTASSSSRVSEGPRTARRSRSQPCKRKGVSGCSSCMRSGGARAEKQSSRAPPT